MKKNSMKTYLICFGFVLISSCSVFLGGVFFHGVYLNDSTLIQSQQSEGTRKSLDLEPVISSTDNYETSESIFAQKLLDYRQNHLV